MSLKGKKDLKSKTTVYVKKDSCFCTQRRAQTCSLSYWPGSKVGCLIEFINAKSTSNVTAQNRIYQMSIVNHRWNARSNERPSARHGHLPSIVSCGVKRLLQMRQALPLPLIALPEFEVNTLFSGHYMLQMQNFSQNWLEIPL